MIVSKGDIINEVTEKLQLRKGIVEDVVNGFITVFKKELIAGNRVTINEFISMIISGSIGESQIGKNPRRLTFRISSSFRRFLYNEGFDDTIERTCDYQEDKKKIKIVTKELSDNEEIEKLNRKILNLYSLNSQLRTSRDKLRQKYKEKRKDENFEKYKKSKMIYAKSQNAVNKRAVEMVYDRMKADRVRNSYFLDAISSYPIITQYQVDNKLDIKLLNLFILMSHFRQFYISDGIAFGYNYFICRSRLKKLIEMGWVEMFGSKKKYYVLSLKGKDEFKKLHSYCNKQLKALFREYDKKLQDRDGGTWVKYNGKFLSKIDILKDE